VKNVPTLKHLLEELRSIKDDPDEVRIPGQLYDDLIDDAEDIAEEDSAEEED
jgi:hypothetical protein